MEQYNEYQGNLNQSSMGQTDTSQMGMSMNQMYANQTNANQMYANQMNMNQGQINQQPVWQAETFSDYSSRIIPVRRKVVNASCIFALLSAVLLTIGLLAPAIDFSHFHEKVNIQYNLVKICKNIGLISGSWIGIPYGIGIGIVLMLVFAFFRVPQLKLIPCAVILAMFIIMLADVGNVIDWVDAILDRYYGENLIEVNIEEIVKSMRVGIYLMASGLVLGIVSCFFKAKDI